MSTVIDVVVLTDHLKMSEVMSCVKVSIARLLIDVMPFLTFMTLMMFAFATALWIVYRPYDGNIKYEFSTIPGVPSTVVRYVLSAIFW